MSDSSGNKVSMANFFYWKFVGYEFLIELINATKIYTYVLSRFQYRWTATVPGTNWYHSHVAFQRGDGLLGMYVVRLPPKDEVHSKSYDYDLTDHHIVAQEWFHGVSFKLWLNK